MKVVLVVLVVVGGTSLIDPCGLLFSAYLPPIYCGHCQGEMICRQCRRSLNKVCSCYLYRRRRSGRPGPSTRLGAARGPIGGRDRGRRPQLPPAHLQDGASFKGTDKKAPGAPGFSSQVTVKGFLGTSGDNKRLTRFPQVTIKDFQ